MDRDPVDRPSHDLELPGGLEISVFVGDAVRRVRPDATLVEVAQVLVDDGVGAVGVGADALVGIVSERDLVRAVAEGVDLAAVTALEVAQTDLVWSAPDATVDDVANLMMDRWIRHVLVGGPDRLVGIVSARDLLGAFVAADGPDID